MFIETIHKNGITIIYVKYASCVTLENRIQKISDNFTEKVCAITDCTDISVNNEFIETSKRLNKEVFSKNVDKACHIDITEGKRILLNAAKDRFSETMLFSETKEEVLKKLASDTDGH